MGYKIKTIEYHKAQLAMSKDRHAESSSLDLMDGATSSWASSQMVTFHEKAIAALEFGASQGIDGPATTVTKLTRDGTPVEAKLVQGTWGTSWRLGDEEAERCGRRFIPTGSRSRIQKSLGLSEKDVVVPAGLWFETSCACVGAPVVFRLEEA